MRAGASRLVALHDALAQRHAPRVMEAFVGVARDDPALLTPAEYRVLRQAGTEAPFTGEYTDTKTVGIYRCRACNTELFRSEQKFESHCGWPSFFSPLAGDKIIEVEDNSLGMRRVEVLCANCKSHLGHVFAGEGYDTPTDLRYCINSISLTLEPAE